jgi:hypothetical protein
MTPDTTTRTAEQMIRLVLIMRRHGASIRTIAKVFGESKSTMGRQVQVLEASHLGQLSKEDLSNDEVFLAALSQKGQKHREGGEPCCATRL